MSGTRVAFVHLLLGLITVFSAYDIATRGEHWPFSSYTMFSRARTNSKLWQLRLYGVSENGGEISLHDRRFLWPFDRSRIAQAFSQLRQQPDAQKLVGEAMEDCLRRYEQRRLRNSDGGPRLTKLRLYDVYWQTDPWASNAEFPIARKLDYEVALPPNTNR